MLLSSCWEIGVVEGRFKYVVGTLCSLLGNMFFPCPVIALYVSARLLRNLGCTQVTNAQTRLKM